MFYSGKVARFMSLAKNVARQSEFTNYRHGAVLVRGGSIINTSPNKDSFCSFGARFRNNLPGHATVHAEIGAILGLDRSITDGAVLYVARIGKLDDFKMSKPCEMCEAALRYVGVRRVVYTIDNEKVGEEKL